MADGYPSSRMRLVGQIIFALVLVGGLAWALTELFPVQPKMSQADMEAAAASAAWSPPSPESPAATPVYPPKPENEALLASLVKRDQEAATREAAREGAAEAIAEDRRLHSAEEPPPPRLL